MCRNTCLASRRMSRERTRVKLARPKHLTSEWPFHSKCALSQFEIRCFYSEGFVCWLPVCVLVSWHILLQEGCAAYVRSSKYAAMSHVLVNGGRKRELTQIKKQHFMPLKSDFCYVNHYYCIVIMINNHAISPEINYPKLSPYMYFYPDTYPTVYILLWLVLCYLFTQCWRFTTAIVGLLRNTVCL